MTYSEESVENKFDFLNPFEYKVLHNVLLPSTGSLETTQIDHVVISRFGLFSIETKAQQGWIYGKTWQKEWKKYFFKIKESFYSPMLQNYCHIKAIKAALKDDFKNIEPISIIVFPNAKEVHVEGTKNAVTLANLLKTIGEYQKIIFTEDEVEIIESILLNTNIEDNETRIEHNRSTARIRQGTKKEIKEKPYKRRWLGRNTGIDQVTNIRGALSTCRKCGLEYLMEDAEKERWPRWEGHCKRCGYNSEA